LRPLASALAVLCGLAASGAASSQSTPRRDYLGNAELRADVGDARIDRVEQWLKAVARHEPGGMDEASVAIDDWPNDDGRDFWIEATVLTRLMHDPSRRTATYEIASQSSRSRTIAVRYTTLQIRRLTVYACAARGLALDHPGCTDIHAAESFDAELRALHARALAARRGGDPNFTLHRAALLHTDIAMAGPLAAAPSDPIRSRAGVAPQHFRLDTSDGQQVDASEVAIHWEFARMMLDAVEAPGGGKPDPSRDDVVRQWYRAVGAWMESRKHHQPDHHDRALQIFPRDPDILFLDGCLHEVGSMPLLQNAARSAVLPPGMVMSIESDRAELRKAESSLRRALEAKPDFAEARLRLGRVLARLGRHEDAARELRQALPALGDDRLRYYGQLFLGGEARALGDAAAARDAFGRAAALFPTAQSPRLALSELARSQGNRTAALRAIDDVFAMTPVESERDDPWWQYDVVQARNADELLAELWRPFRTQQ